MDQNKQLCIRQLNQLALDFLALPDQFKYEISKSLNLVGHDEYLTYSDVDIEALEDEIWINMDQPEMLQWLEDLVEFYGQRSP